MTPASAVPVHPPVPLVPVSPPLSTPRLGSRSRSRAGPGRPPLAAPSRARGGKGGGEWVKGPVDRGHGIGPAEPRHAQPRSPLPFLLTLKGSSRWRARREGARSLTGHRVDVSRWGREAGGRAAERVGAGPAMSVPLRERGPTRRPFESLGVSVSVSPWPSRV